jgi:hypothetical protein
MKKRVILSIIAGAVLCFSLGALFEQKRLGQHFQHQLRLFSSSSSTSDAIKDDDDAKTTPTLSASPFPSPPPPPERTRWKLDGEELRKTIEWIDALETKEKKIFSQNGEDGIVEAIFDRIGEGEKYYVEFGTENGNEVNTRVLREQKNWTGLLMDGGHSNPAINLHKEFITASGICGLFEKYKVPRPSIDLLSVDVDFLDFHVLKRILECGYEPRVLIVEHNSALGAYRSATVPSSLPESSRWDGSNFFGASILAFSKLAREYNLSLLYADKLGVNLFFVADKELGEVDIALASWVRQKFNPPGYGRGGHPPDRLARAYDVV